MFICIVALVAVNMLLFAYACDVFKLVVLLFAPAAPLSVHGDIGVRCALSDFGFPSCVGWPYLSNATRLIRPHLFSTALLEQHMR